MDMITPTLEEVKEFAAKGYGMCPIKREILSDFTTPVESMRRLMSVSKHCFMLESADATKRWGRFSFLGYEPEMDVTCLNGKMTIGDRTFETTEPDKEIRALIDARRSPQIPGMPPFTGGLMGYFGYDYIKYAEPSLKLDSKDEEGFMDVDLMLFDKLIVFDNYTQKLMLIANVRLYGDVEADYARAVAATEEMEDIIRNAEPAVRHGKMKGDFEPLFDKETFCGMVEKAKHHIREGDIFQVVPSNRLEVGFEGSLFDTYRVLRTLNPSPYMFYMSGDMEVAGASPETLVKLENGIVHTFPLAGTRPRGATEEEDLALEKDLLEDPKELAEHNMLVDLGRNDIGKISEFGTVEVEKYHEVVKFSHVMHIGSTVSGKLRSDLTAMDAINAILPAGTLSGAPKLRACQIINDLEDNKRGIYGGAIGYIGLAGNMDTAIAIRIVYKKNGKAFVRSGAGIVADSVPENEFQECMNKAKALVVAMKEAEGMQ